MNALVFGYGFSNGNIVFDTSFPLSIGLFMAAAAFWVVALFHALIWARQRGMKVHLWFALTTFLSGFAALAEAAFYKSGSVAAFIEAFRWSNNINVLWLVSVLGFVTCYTGTWPARRWVVLSLSAVLLLAALANSFLPFGFLYTEITALRYVVLPWGERIAFAEGVSSTWRVATDAAFVAVIVLIAVSFRDVWQRGERRGALMIGGSLLLYMVLLLVTGVIVDLALLPIPYLFTWGYLAVAFAMSHELAGEVVRASALSAEVRSNERRWRSLLEHVQLLVAGVDRRGCIDYVNPFCTDVTGYSSEELVGNPIGALLAPDARDGIEEEFEAAMSGELRPRVERFLLTKKGEQRLVVWSSVLQRDPHGGATGTLSIGADVTDQRKAEKAREAALTEIETLTHRLEDEVVYLKSEITTTGRFEAIVGESDALKYVLQKVEEVAPLDTTVLIEGETGVGKELFARAIHEHSPRSARPLVKVNCATLPANLVEAELFGHERGAFTGATRLRRGRFELADRGTLFLDEVGELPLDLQAKFLGVLQEGELERVGGEATIRVDVRVIAATNRNLKQEVDRGAFREDLYYRLHVYPITVPTLRRRRDDIPLLVNALVGRFARAQGKDIVEIPKPVMDELVNYDWPGNVRELENVLERAVITSSSKVLRLAARLEPRATTDGDYQGSLQDVERAYVSRILELSAWRIEGRKGAAERLGLHPNTLRFRMRKLGIKRPAVPTH